MAVFPAPDDRIAGICPDRIALLCFLGLGLVVQQEGKGRHTDAGYPVTGEDADDGYETKRTDHRDCRNKHG